MTATDELRRLLDERGVEHVDGEYVTYTNDADFIPAAGGTFDVTLYERTPEQAIEATLGRGTCHAVFEVDAMSEDERVGEFVCSECGETFGDGRDQLPHYCPNCGRRCVG